MSRSLEKIEFMARTTGTTFNVIHCDLCGQRIGPNLAPDGTMEPMPSWFAIGVYEGSRAYSPDHPVNARDFCASCFSAAAKPTMESLGFKSPDAATPPLDEARS